MNARNADHARTWLRETDRLETGWSCGERPYHPLCSHDPGPHSPGCRHWCNLDCTDVLRPQFRQCSQDYTSVDIPGPHSPGCRHWCNLDCTNGIEAATRRARRVVRGRCILYADILRLFCAAD